MFIADDIAILGRERLYAIVMRMFADGLADWQIIEQLPGATLADVATALVWARHTSECRRPGSA